MAQIESSLYRTLRQRSFLILLSAFLAISVCLLVFIELLNQSSVEKNLTLKHQIVENTFSNYLVRAEGEMRFIGQNLAFAVYEPDRELDMLFSHHDVLFRGGLDFFYIDWLKAKPSMDPRARLFTKTDFSSLLKKGFIHRWVPVLTKDNAILLMRKQSIISVDQEITGFLYGFISLNDNLTLANELLDSADLSSIQIVDLTKNQVLLRESRDIVDSPNSVLGSRLPLRSAVYADLELEISQKHSVLSDALLSALFFLALLICILIVCYWVLLRIIKTSVFSPINAIVSGHHPPLHFIELKPIQNLSFECKTSLEAKERRFSLLTESVGSAVIFCNEVAEVELINTEASSLFPSAGRSRTLFDFMPIASHQSIQEALKGGIGITFDLTMGVLGLIYHWRVYPFENESRYRGVLLVGQNITQESSLTWQLAQLTPLSSAIEKKVDTDAILNELNYLSALPSSVNANQLQGWLHLITQVLGEIGDEESEVSFVSLGDIICQESARVMSEMGGDANRAVIDCSVESSVKVVAADKNVRNLIRVLFMMVMSNDIAERRLSIAFDGAELELTTFNDRAIRPLFNWVINMLITPLHGQQKVLQNHTLKLNIKIKEQESSSLICLSGKVVAWLVNDYHGAEAVTESLIRLGLRVEQYASNDSFFTGSGEVPKFDAVLIGCDKDIEAQSEMTRALKLKYNREDLPIVWLNNALRVDVDPHVVSLQGCVFDYSLYQVLERPCSLEGMMTSQLSTQGRFWLMIGGSRVAKAVWYNELERANVTTQWLTDLSHYYAALSYHTDTTVVLLEPQPTELLRTIQSAFPRVRFFSLQRWPEMPDNVALFEMAWPYSGDQIKAFTQNVMQQTTATNNKDGE